MANLGRVAYVHRGAYNSGALYEKYDVVYESTTNSAYAYINNVATVGSAVTNETYWTLLVSGSELNSTAENMPYLFIKYSENEPTTDGEISDTPGDWMGVYVGTSHTAPTTYNSYTWHKINGVHVGDDAPLGTETLWIDTDEPDLIVNYQDVLDAGAAAVVATGNANDATDRANTAAQRIEDTEDAIAGIEAAAVTAAGVTAAIENANAATAAAVTGHLWRKTTSGNPVSVYPVPESPLYPKVSGAFTQEGTGDPSPENIRPITPWLANGANMRLANSGKNLFDAATIGQYSSWDHTGLYSKIVLVTTPGQYYFKCVPTTTVFSGIVGLSKSGEGVDVKQLANDAAEPDVTNTPYTAVTLSAGETLYLIWYTSSKSQASLDTVMSTILASAQLEFGSTATPYEPYSGQEITLTAPQEIPAGWMDNEGQGQGTWGKKVFDGTEVGLISVSGAYLYYALPVGPKDVVVDNVSSCSHFKRNAALSVVVPGDNIFNVVNSTGYNDARIIFRPAVDGVTDLDTLKTWLADQYAAGTPLTVVYQLATPVALTPVAAPLTALPQLDRITPRQNVLTASTGNVELTYAKSPIQQANELEAAIALL